MDVIKTYIPKRYRNKKLVNTGGGNGSSTVVNSGSSDISPSAFVDSDTFYSMFELVDLSGTPAIKAKHEFFSVAGVTAYGTGTVATGGSGSSVSVLDVLNSTDTGSALSANMGRVLNEGKLNRSEISSWALGANKPAYGISEITGLSASLSGKSAVGHAHTISEISDFAHVHQWNDIENKPSVITNTTASFTTALETKLNGIATGAEVNVNADWNATSGAALILNKPTTFSGTFYGNLIGNATSATGLQYARTIWGQAFDGNSNVSGTLDLGSGDLTWGGWGAGKATLAGVPNGVMIYPKGNAYAGEVYINGNLIYHTGNFTNLNQLTTRNFSDLQNKPTTIGGYGITDAYTKTYTDATYLKLTGGTLTGNLTAPTFIGALTGNAATATKLSSSRTFALTGDVTGTITSDLTSGFSIVTTIAPNSVALGTDTTGNYAGSVGVSGNGLTITGTAGEGTTFTVNSNATSLNTASTLVFRDASGNFSAGTITAQTDILIPFYTWSNATDRNSLKKFLELFDLDTAGNLVVKRNLYSTGEITAYSSGTGVSGLKLMGDMNANTFDIFGARSISSGLTVIGDDPLAITNDGSSGIYCADNDGIIAAYSPTISRYIYAHGYVYFDLATMGLVSPKVSAGEFKFGNWTFKEVSGNMVISYNGIAKATILSSRTNSNL